MNIPSERPPFDLDALVRENIKSLAPYRCARDDYDSGILLDANENALGPVVSHLGDLHRYPSPYQWELKQKIGAFRGIAAEQIFTGVGSDEPIDLLIRIFCRPGKDSIIITTPTYGMYKVSASINDVQVVDVPLTPDFQLQVDEILTRQDETTKVLFLCSPNNPTGNNLKRDDMLKLAEEFKGIVVIDEAYIDFTQQASMIPELQRFPNVVVLQTMSKSFGMAGIRLGMAFASPEIIRLMMNVKSPYNINELTSRVANEVMDKVSIMQKKVAQLIQERSWLAEQLKAIPAVEHVFPSDANFLLFRVQNAFQVYKQIADDGVVARYRGDQRHCTNGIRITVGTRDENIAFLEKLKGILA